MVRCSTRPGARSEPEDPIEVCRRLLGLRELTLCRAKVHMARESDPNSKDLTQILAIADVLLAAESRVADGLLDFYSILQVTRPECETGPVVLKQFKKLVMLLSPSVNKFPFGREALDFVCQAWSVLSKREKKELYDLEIAHAEMSEDAVGDRGKQETHVETGGGDAEEQKDGTFWTMCPYCCFLYEYGRVYKELCLRCQNCRRGFHGMEVGPLPESFTAEGVDKYTCQMGAFRFEYPFHGFFSPKETNAGESVDGTNNMMDVSDDGDGGDDNSGDGDAENGETGESVDGTNTVMDVSDDDDDDEDDNAWNEDAENGEIGVKPEVKNQDTVNTERIVLGRLNGKRVKMTAWNTKKGMDVRMRKQMRKRKISAEAKRFDVDDDDDDDGDDPHIIKLD